jgi:hypothetical protein
MTEKIRRRPATWALPSGILGGDKSKVEVGAPAGAGLLRAKIVTLDHFVGVKHMNLTEADLVLHPIQFQTLQYRHSKEA